MERLARPQQIAMTTMTPIETMVPMASMRAGAIANSALAKEFKSSIRRFYRFAVASERTANGKGDARQLKGKRIDRISPCPYIARHGGARHPHHSRQAAAAEIRAGEGRRQDMRALIEDMFETMYAAPGIGLAAIQIGAARRVVTMDLAKKDEPKQPQVFINPEIDLGFGRKGDLRGRLPVDSGILRGGRAPEDGPGEVSRSRRQAAGDRGRRAARHLPAARDRPYSTACCSSIIFPSSSATW